MTPNKPINGIVVIRISRANCARRKAPVDDSAIRMLVGLRA